MCGVLPNVPDRSYMPSPVISAERERASALGIADSRYFVMLKQRSWAVTSER
jgi:hypothetical protein